MGKQNLKPDNVMTKSVGRVHYVSPAEIYTLDETSLVNEKVNKKTEQFDVISVLIEIFFFTTGCPRTRFNLRAYDNFGLKM